MISLIPKIGPAAAGAGTYSANIIAAAEAEILVVDDIASVREIVRLTLERGGFAPHCVRNGADAVRALKQKAFFAILVDLLMPDMDGLELLRHVKCEHPNTSVIAMTGSSGVMDYLDIALKLGADDVIRKPFQPIQLIEVVSKQRCLWELQRSDERRFVRMPIVLDGQIFDPASAASHPCKLLNISAGGVLIACDGKLERDENYVLFIEQFGRFEVCVAHRRAGEFGLEFAMGIAKRTRLIDMLGMYMADGAQGVMQMRKSPHTRIKAEVEALCADGEIIACSVIDISLEGASLKAPFRPSIGEIVTVGKTSGRVVRHHEDGFAIRFVVRLNGEIPTAAALGDRPVESKN